MSNKEAVKINAADNVVSYAAQGDECPALIKKIGKTT